MTDSESQQFDSSGCSDIEQLLSHVAAADIETARDLMRENPSLAKTVLSDSALKQALSVVLGKEDKTAGPHPVIKAGSVGVEQVDVEQVDVEPPGVFTELTRTLTPEHAEALYRKITPLLVYELIRTLDRGADIGTVQRIVDRLCGSEVQKRLRTCEHVRDGILEEIADVLCDVGIREALDRDGVAQVMADCGVLGELSTMENCVRLMRAQAG